jgi:NAD(P)H dehydrogenase (quinone)
VQHLSNVVQDYRDGIFAGTNDYVQTIGGKRPMTVEEYVEQHRGKHSATTGLTPSRSLPSCRESCCIAVFSTVVDRDP